MNVILAGFLASLAAGLATGLGGVAVLFRRQISRRGQDLLLGFAAGVMLSASFFSLILPALERSREAGATDIVAALIAVAGVLLGVGAMAVANEIVPHRHAVQGRQGPRSAVMSNVHLLVLAITIHNLPEGLAVGVGYAGGDEAGATALALGIGLQNIPEGLAVAVALVAAGMSRIRAMAIATATGLVEPIGGLLGVTVVTLAAPILPWALHFAAGAMIYVVSHEIIPETHSRGFQREATAGLAVGLVAMMFLDVAFG
ncbi:MAG: ZIP family metal transporter [Bauldia sp.]|nr:ZIP family metal transporter [Bauldia sp.]